MRSSRVPVLLLLALPIAAHLPDWLLHLRNDPLWLFSGLARDQSPGWLPGHPFTDPNVGYTTQALGRLAALDWLHAIVPWWNPYTGIGMPLAGEMQPGAFFLPFNLLLALPNGVVWLTITMQALAGLTTYALLRALRLSPLAALMGGALYALNGTIAWVPGPSAVFCSLPFLPLLLWGIERAKAEPSAGRYGRAAILAIAVAIAWSLLAGFPETAYLDGLLALAWALALLPNAPRRKPLLRRIGAGGVLGLMLAAPLLIAFADDLAASDVVAHHVYGDAALPPQALAMLLLPSIYGPPNAATDAATIGAVAGNIGGYTSALIVVLTTIGVTHAGRRLRLRLFLLAWTILCLGKTFGLEPARTLFNLVPAIDHIEFFRYAAPSWELALVILAAFGLDALRQHSSRRVFILPVIVVVALAAGAGALVGAGGLGTNEHQAALVAGWARRSIAWTMAGLLLAILAGCYLRPARGRRVIAVLVVLDAAMMAYLPQCAGLRAGRLDLLPIRYLQARAGLSRTVTLGPLSPNFAAYFGLAGLNHNVSPVPRLWTRHVDAELFPGAAAHDGGLIFWPAWPAPFDSQGALDALLLHLPAYLDLGVRYVMTVPGQSLVPTIAMKQPECCNYPLTLQSGQAVRLAVAAPAWPASIPHAPGGIAELGVLIGTFGGAADGDLAMQICAGNTCRHARHPLAGAADTDFLYATLDAPLEVPAGTALQVALTYSGGHHPMALWAWANSDAPAQLLDAPGGAAPRTALRLAFRGSTTAARQVLASRAADIWELADPAPYFEAMPKAACILSPTDRETIAANCNRPATLIRRELFMPGWQASVNTRPIEVAMRRGLFQQIPLRPGASTITFTFAPPYVGWGWCASLLAVAVMAWQVERDRRDRLAVRKRGGT